MNASAMPTHTVLVDGLRIRYADSGTADGPVILCTSPWPESLFAFRRVWPSLARTGRLVAVDLPGFGHSQGRADVLTPSAMGDFLGRFITELGLGTPHLVAPDVGASAALFLAARHPDAMRSLVAGGTARPGTGRLGGLRIVLRERPVRPVGALRAQLPRAASRAA